MTAVTQRRQHVGEQKCSREDKKRPEPVESREVIVKVDDGQQQGDKLTQRHDKIHRQWWAAGCQPEHWWYTDVAEASDKILIRMQQ